MGETETPTHPWNEYAFYVLKSIEKLDEKISNISDKIDANKETSAQEVRELKSAISDVKREVAVLKERINIRSSIFGSIGSAITLLAFFLIQLLIKK